MNWRFTSLFLLAASQVATAQWLDLPTPGVPRTADGSVDMTAPAPRTRDGVPDLSGLWVATRITGDLPASDKYLPWVREAMQTHTSNFFSDQPRYNCLPSGPSYLTAGSTSTGFRRIIQSADMIGILHEDQAFRTIYMDGRELENDPLPTWMGYSVARWDNDTLVVDSNGYNDKTWLDRRGIMHTEALQITERYTRRDFGHMTLDVTYTDAGAFTAPLEVKIEIVNQADDELLEYVCNETAHVGAQWEGNIEEAKKTAVEIDAEILSQYIGTYQGIWLGNLVTLEFSLEGEKLKLKRDGVEIELVPQSTNSFDGSNGFAFVFGAVKDGVATAVEEVHVSGGWSFPRVP